ncbi:ribonuclease E inhibitor RraB [Candidatus Laterigemmans baculatus]|uniref:ribonuclease E inhibitor RraB n=1 Tax=Candidatus Laterigemmans baculatus TaxID=2770505 RepID=UPI0013DAC189|nr:hypothetical protein [Candidatus Laterigemmans baculatus]
MSEETDLSLDVDSLFDHLKNNLGHELGDEKEWVFALRGEDLELLQQVAQDLEDEFIVHIQETVEEVDAEGNSSSGPPALCIVQRAALTADEVKAIAGRLQAIAAERALVYEGVTCYEPIDEEELFGWIPPDEAGWRLRNMSDCGIEENEELPWAFLLGTPSLDSMQTLADDLTSHGFSDYDVYDEPDEEGEFGLCVFVAGRNNEAELAETAAKIAEVAAARGGRLEGIQFYTREDVDHVFGEDDEI